jgi:hypothetical protein
MLKQLLWKIRNKHVELKAQYTIYALFMTVLSIVAYVAVFPLLNDTITNSGVTGMEGTLLSYSPLFIFLFILWSAMWYVNPHRRE